MPLDILHIEQKRQNFYAPAFNIVVGTDSVVRDLRLEVTSVQVEMVLGGRADRFTFTINNAFDISKREFVKVGGKTVPEFFSFGLPLAVHMGYGDHKKLDLMIAGTITELNTSFPSSGLPLITVSGYDHSYPLTLGATSRNWGEKRKDSDVVREIARGFNLQAKVENTDVIHRRIDQTNESTAAFLTRLADRNGFEWFVTQKELHFRKTVENEQGVIELVWGRGLVNFSPRISLSEQITEVQVHGWNVQTMSPIVGRARKGDEPGRDRARPSGRARISGADALARVVKDDQGVLKVRRSVHSQQEADQLALSILKKRSQGFVSGRGDSIGIPEIRPNKTIALRGLGDMVSATLPVKEATHTVDTSGYRTSFEIEDPTV